MVMAYIWTGMILIAVLFSFWSGTGGALSQAVLEGAQAGVTLTFSMAGAACLWSGVGQVMEKAGLNRILARFLSPVIDRLFPSARRDAKVGNLISANVCANLLGLGNAATPMGIAATKRMSRYAKPGEASHEIQLIPANVAAVRAGLGCAAPFDILPAVWVTSLCSVSVGLLAAFLLQRVSKHD